jgi:HPt (histidine-containing phosphotransfer) domain-containing protein
MNDCIGKPLQRDLLVSMVQKWIGAKSNSHLNANPKDEIRLTAEKPDTNQFPLNLDRALQEFLGKKEILYGVLHEFMIKAKIRIDTIQQAVKGFDYGAIASEAHGIKGGAANLRADKLASLAADLENAGEMRQPDLSAELADKLEQEFYNLEKYIRQLPEV